MTLIRQLLLFVPLVALAACSPASEPSAPSDSDSPTAQSAEPTNRIDIPATVRRNLGITFAQVQVRDVEHTLRVPGAFELQPLARHEYRMSLPGKVQLLVDQYDPVQPGTPLFRYQSPSWPELLHEIIQGEQAIEAARAEIKVKLASLDETTARLTRARQRIEDLAQADFKKADLEVQAADLEAALPRIQAEVELAETRLVNAERTRKHALHRAATASGIPEDELDSEFSAPDAGKNTEPKYHSIDWIEVRASEPGVVEALAITDGAFVEPPSRVLSTVDPERIRFRALALQADLPKISGSRAARIVPPPTPGFPMEDGIPAAMTFGLEAHPEERTITLMATPTETADWIRPGVSAFLEIVTESTQGPALAVPRSAVVQDGLTHLVFRRDPSDPNKAIRVEADLGVSDGLWVVLNSGVMRGDEVVLAGAYELKLAAQQSRASQMSGHVHADGSFHDEH